MPLIRAVFVTILVSTFWFVGCSDDPPTASPTDDDGPSIPRPALEWTEHAANPVFGPAENGWDDGFVLRPAVIRDGEGFRMWYVGTRLSPYLEGGAAIGYAVSDDGVIWERVGSEPVFEARSDAWDHTSVGSPIVFADGDTLRMWYGAGGTTPADFDIGYAHSTDGIEWTRHPSPVIERGAAGEWNSESLVPGPVIREGGVFRMWFQASISDGSGGGVGYATSPDGIEWTLYDDPGTSDPPYRFSDPVLSADSESWDARLVNAPWVLRTGSGYEMWYGGASASAQRIGYATSIDGIDWVKTPFNPVLHPQPGWVPSAPVVIPDGDRHLMWFQGWSGNRSEIGLAVGRPR